VFRPVSAGGPPDPFGVRISELDDLEKVAPERRDGSVSGGESKTRAEGVVVFATRCPRRRDAPIFY